MQASNAAQILSSRLYNLPHGGRDESRLSPDFEVPLTGLNIEVVGDPSIHREISRVEFSMVTGESWMDLRG